MATVGKVQTFYKRKFFSRENIENFSNKYLASGEALNSPCGCKYADEYAILVTYVGILMAGFVKGLNGSIETVLLDSPVVASFLLLLKLLTQTYQIQILPNNL